MFSRKLNCLYDKALVFLICAWGNWGLYYLCAVLLFDASFVELKAYAWVFCVSLLGSMIFLMRVSFHSSEPVVAIANRSERFLAVPVSKSFWLLVGALTAASLVLVLLIHHFAISETLLVYNLAWVGLLPFFLAITFRYRRPAPSGVHLVRVSLSRVQQVDSLLPLLCFATLAFGLYGMGFPSPDDAYYGHIMSSLVAKPTIPILGSDTLLATDAPFLLHPAYRPVGYEVLVAAIGDRLGIEPARLLYRVMALPNAFMWVLAVYAFMRTVRVPLPGIALTVCLVTYVIWTSGFAPGTNFIFLYWGKSLLLLVTAPMLFTLVCAYLEKPGLRPWMLLLLAVAATATWSSSALFVAPVALGISAAVLVPSIVREIRSLLIIAASLAPIFVSLAYSLWVLSWAPIPGDMLNPGILRVQGEAFGTIEAQIVVLLVLPLALLLSRTVDDARFQRTVYRLCLVGFFTVLTPYMLEFISVLLGTNFLARRLQYAYPSTQLLGVLVSITVVHLLTWRGGLRRFNLQAVAAVVVVFVLFFASIQPRYLFGSWWEQVVPYRQDYREVRAVRALIPDGAYVAAGDVDDLLPLLPDPPTFTYVRHYLDYHRGFMSEAEYHRRRELFVLLSLRSPKKKERLEQAVARTVRIANELAVTTLVYQPPGARRRLPVLSIHLYGRHVSAPEAQKTFTELLTRRLRGAGFDCQTTPSGRTWVCNRVERGPAV